MQYLSLKLVSGIINQSVFINNTLCISVLLPPTQGLVDVIEAVIAVSPLTLSPGEWALYADLHDVTTELVHKRDSS